MYDVVEKFNEAGEVVPISSLDALAFLRQGSLAVFGTKEEQLAAQQAEEARKQRVERELRLSHSGAGALVFGVNPQINVNPIDLFTTEETQVDLMGPDALLRSDVTFSAVKAANLSAQRQKDELNPVCGLYRWVNTYPEIAAIGLGLLFFALNRKGGK